MRLLDLEPRWIHPNMFCFQCPHCKQVLLTCKNVVMSHREQWDLFNKEFGEPWNELLVGCKPDMAWTIEGDFQNMTVSPSLDASASGHWHGHIQNGNIVGGVILQ